MAMAWEPDCAVATSSAHRDLVSESPKPGTFVGWVMYLSARRGTVPPLPGPVRIEPIEDKGTLIVLTPERFTAANPEHVALAERVGELLARAGLMQPVTP
nr:immunity 52 family protein [Pyxidicoccus trucidator]